MKDIAKIYSTDFHRNRREFSWRAKPLVDSIVKYLSPRSVLDVGCSVGDIIAEFQSRGTESYGLECSEAVMEFLLSNPYNMIIHDMRMPPPVPLGVYDLTLCFEVIEHVGHRHIGQFIRNLITTSHRILMSAAHPGQKGVEHVSCYPLSYWEDRFAEFGYLRRQRIADEIKGELVEYEARRGLRAIIANLVYFEKVRGEDHGRYTGSNNGNPHGHPAQQVEPE